MKLFLILLLCGTAQAADLRPYSLSPSAASAVYVPYLGATGTVNLGSNALSAGSITGSSLTVTGAMQAGGGGGDATAGDITVDPTNKTVHIGRLSATGGNNGIFNVRNRTGVSLFRVDASSAIDNTGYFQASGQIVAVGTMTVLGNAFSVGGGKLSVASTGVVTISSVTAVMGGTTGLYYCNGGASLNSVCRGTGCTCVGGTWTDLGLRVP